MIAAEAGKHLECTLSGSNMAPVDHAVVDICPCTESDVCAYLHRTQVGAERVCYYTVQNLLRKEVRRVCRHKIDARCVTHRDMSVCNFEQVYRRGDESGREIFVELMTIGEGGGIWRFMLSCWIVSSESGR